MLKYILLAIATINIKAEIIKQTSALRGLKVAENQVTFFEKEQFELSKMFLQIFDSSIKSDFEEFLHMFENNDSPKVEIATSFQDFVEKAKKYLERLPKEKWIKSQQKEIDQALENLKSIDKEQPVKILKQYIEGKKEIFCDEENKTSELIDNLITKLDELKDLEHLDLNNVIKILTLETRDQHNSLNTANKRAIGLFKNYINLRIEDSTLRSTFIEYVGSLTSITSFNIFNLNQILKKKTINIDKGALNLLKSILNQLNAKIQILNKIEELKNIFTIDTNEIKQKIERLNTNTERFNVQYALYRLLHNPIFPLEYSILQINLNNEPSSIPINISMWNDLSSLLRRIQNSKETKIQASLYEQRLLIILNELMANPWRTDNSNEINASWRPGNFIISEVIDNITEDMQFNCQITHALIGKTLFFKSSNFGLFNEYKKQNQNISSDILIRVSGQINSIAKAKQIDPNTVQNLSKQELEEIEKELPNELLKHPVYVTQLMLQLYDLIIFPVGNGGHFTTLVINAKSKTITHIDSLSIASSSTLATNVLKQLIDADSSKFSDWKTETFATQMQQGYENTCGIYTLVYALTIALSGKVDKNGIKLLEKFRPTIESLAQFEKTKQLQHHQAQNRVFNTHYRRELSKIFPKLEKEKEEKNKRLYPR